MENISQTIERLELVKRSEHTPVPTKDLISLLLHIEEKSRIIDYLVALKTKKELLGQAEMLRNSLNFNNYFEVKETLQKLREKVAELENIGLPRGIIQYNEIRRKLTQPTGEK